MLIVDKLREATEARYNNAAGVRVTGAMLTTAACLSGATTDLQKVPTPLTPL
jgi:hypothetical protein